jgi:hypothetical protein
MVRCAIVVILASTYAGCATSAQPRGETTSAHESPRAQPAQMSEPEVCVPCGGLNAADANLDWDGDGILNGDDSCTKMEEDFDGVEDGDGCPEKTLVVLVNRSVYIKPADDALLRTSSSEIAFVQPLLFDGATLTSENDEALSLLARVMIQGDVDGHVACAQDDEAKVVVAWLTAHGVPRDKVHAVVHSDATPLETPLATPSGQCVVRYSQCVIVEHEKRSQ